MRIVSSYRARPVRRGFIAALAVTLWTVVLAGSGIAQTASTPRYDIIDLGTLDPNGSGAGATSINNTGQIVGTYRLGAGADSADRGFLYDIATASMIDLGVLHNRRNIVAWAVNDRPQVVGQANNSPETPLLFSGFLWDNGTLTDLTPTGSAQSWASAINGKGQIAGSAHVRYEFTWGYWDVPHAAVFTDGTWMDLGALFPPRPPAYNPSEATGINESGQVVGYFGGNVYPRSFLYTPGDPATWMELNPSCPFADCLVYPDDINDRGQVVGRLSYSALPRTSLAFLYDNGSIQTLPSLGGASNWAFAINNSGQVVGYSQNAAGFIHGFLYQDGTTYDLNDLVPPGSGWTVGTAYDINDAGLIVGGGQRAGDQKGHAYLLVPKIVDAGGPYSVAEGGTIVVTATGFGTKPLAYAWDLDGDGAYEASGQSVTFDAATIDGPASRTIRVQAVDGDGVSGTSEATVNVLNVAPTAVLAAAPTTLYAGQATTLTFSSPNDPSPADGAGLVYLFDCTGDGVPEPAPAGDPMQAGCLFASAGTFTASGMVADDDGGSTSYSLTITVLSPQEGIQNLIDEVGALVPSPLSQAEAGSLIVKLDAAINQLDKGHVTPVVKQLQAFIDEVNALIRSGRLDQATGEDLIDATNDIIMALGG